MIFKDRSQAGRLLAIQLADYANDPDAVVLVVSAGGVHVGIEVAKALDIAIDVLGPNSLDLHDRNVILIDDIIATGSTMMSAISMVKRSEPLEIIAAAPVVYTTAQERLKVEADALAFITMSEKSNDANFWYQNDTQASRKIQSKGNGSNYADTGDSAKSVGVVL
jgi:predicted phosphoribosyltransferase